MWFSLQISLKFFPSKFSQLCLAEFSIEKNLIGGPRFLFLQSCASYEGAGIESPPPLSPRYKEKRKKERKRRKKEKKRKKEEKKKERKKGTKIIIVKRLQIVTNAVF